MGQFLTIGHSLCHLSAADILFCTGFVFYLYHVSTKYLELRFSRATRLLGTVLFIVQTVSKKPLKPIMTESSDL